MTLRDLENKLITYGGILVILVILAVIVGVMWTASTGRSGQRVYLWSALISMLILVGLFMLISYISHGEMYDILEFILFFGTILLAGFILTAIITISTGNSTDSLPYLISAVGSIALGIFIMLLSGRE